MKTKIIRKEKINWVITKNVIYAFDNLQATAYHMYGCSNRKPLAKMKKRLMESTPDMYKNWIDAITLAKECKIYGYGSAIHPEWFRES